MIALSTPDRPPEHLVAGARDAVPSGSHAFVYQLHASWSAPSAPEVPVAVDPRVELCGIRWYDYYLVSAGREGLERVLHLWNVRVLVLEPTQAEGLLAVLEEKNAGWRRIASDVNGAVYVRD